MKAKFVHRCTHVLDKEKTIAFYEKALGFHVVRESGPADGSWTNTFMGNDASPFRRSSWSSRGIVAALSPTLTVEMIPTLPSR